jgi:hypothetical protein
MLKDILNLLARDGVNVNDEASKAHAVIGVNNGCKRMYTKRDLEGSVNEELFQVSVTSNQVALPPNVGIVRKIRPYGTYGDPANLSLMQSYYQTSGSKWLHSYNFRMRPARPLLRSINNASVITFSLPLPANKSCDFVIVGTNDVSANKVVTVTLPAGSMSVTTTDVFSDIKKLLRSGDDSYDVTVTDVNDNVLAIIPNNYAESKHEVLQVLDSGVQPIQAFSTYPVELMYKRALPYLKNDNDSFICGDVYDEAIFWEYKIFESALKGDIKSMAAANAAQSDIINNISMDIERGKDKRIDVARNPYIAISDQISRSYN